MTTQPSSTPPTSATLALAVAVVAGAGVTVDAITSLHGAPQASGIVAGCAAILGAVWRYIASHDAHLAARVTLLDHDASAWYAANWPALAAVVRAADTLPGLPGRVAQLEQTAAAATGVDVEAVARAVRDRLVNDALSAPQSPPAATPVATAAASAAEAQTAAEGRQVA